MTYNLTGINFHKPQTSNSNNKNQLITGANQVNENRSSSAFDQKRFNLHSSPNSKNRNHLVNHDEKAMKKVYDFIPKINKVPKTAVMVDPDKLQDQLIKLKVDLNNKVKDFNMLKVEYNRLEEENKKNHKVIEEFINEATKFSPDINNYLRNNQDAYNSNENNNNIGENDVNFDNENIGKNDQFNRYSNNNNLPNKMNFTSINPASIIKLREVFMINSLKKQISNFKQILKHKEEEILTLKTSSKVAKFQLLETEYRQTTEDYFQVKEGFEKMKDSMLYKDSRIKELQEETDYYKTITNKIKSQLDETREKMKFYQEENLKIMEQKKNLEEKQNYNKFASNSYKSQIQSKENEINILKDEMKNFEIFKNEKPKLEKRVMDLQKQLSVLKEDNERKTQRIKDLDKIVFNNKVSFEQEMENLTSMMNKKLKVLEHENSNLRKSEANKDKLGIKSSAFLTETKLEKKETTESIEEVRGKIKNLEDELLIEVENNKKLDSKLKEIENENSNLKIEKSKLELEKEEFLKEINKYQEMFVEYEEKIESNEKEKIYFEELLEKYQHMFNKENNSKEKNSENIKETKKDNVKEKKKDKIDDIKKVERKEDLGQKDKKKIEIVSDKEDYKEEISKKVSKKEKRVEKEILIDDKKQEKEESVTKKEKKREKELIDEKEKAKMMKKNIENFDNEIIDQKQTKNKNKKEKIEINDENTLIKSKNKSNHRINDTKNNDNLQINRYEDNQNYEFDDYKEEDSIDDNKIPDSFNATVGFGGFKKNKKPSRDDNE